MDPIAIIGIGCRFPQSPNPEAFWQTLCRGVDAITEIPSDRWNADEFYDLDPDEPGKINARYGGFLEQPQIDSFDPHLFKISPREAISMDPQQRLLLEIVWEALEDAGQVKEKLAGSPTGVFIGISTNDYSRIESDYATQPQGYDLTGNALNIAAGRISYSFNFRGPSMVVDTACSSSLVAVHLACQSIWHEESTLAVAGGVNLLLSPIGSLGLTKLKALSPDGRCKAFDASANGYVRSEGAGCVVLKPLSQAIADGDPIYATIRGSAINHDGQSKGLTVPYGPSQSAVIRSALKQAGVSPAEVNYIEAHGTGTVLGDPIEAMALADVLSEGRNPHSVCALGAVKSNIGHLEAAAGIAALIKVALSLKHGQIPPSLHFQKANRFIPFEDLPLRVQTSLTDWPDVAGSAKAGVSAFGFSGTNAHVVLAQAPAVRAPEQAPAEPEAHQNEPENVYLLPLSAHSPAALKSLIETYHGWLQTSPNISLPDLCYTASVRRTHHQHRAAIVASSLAQLQQQLDQLSSQSLETMTKRRGPKVAFVFTGDRTGWLGMGRRLLAREPVFRQAIARCDALIQARADWSLLDELTADETDETRSRLQSPAIAQPAIFAVQVAIAHLWQHWGIEPKAVVGHGIGEIAAALIAGQLSLEDAVKIACDYARPDAPSELSIPYQIQTAKLPLFSCALADWITDSNPGPHRWVKAFELSANLADSLTTVAEAGYPVLLEISPIPQIQLPDNSTAIAIASLRPHQSEYSTLLKALGILYTKGQSVRWSTLFPSNCQMQSLPLYPWQRERYWVQKTPETPAETPVSGHPLIGQALPLAVADTVFSTQLSLQQQSWLRGHQVAGRVVLPGAAYLEMALATSSQPDLAHPQHPHQLENISIEAAMILPASGHRLVQMIVSPDGEFRIVSAEPNAEQSASDVAAANWIQHASGRLSTTALTPEISLTEAKTRCCEPVERASYYRQLRSRRLEYGETFQGIQQLWHHEREALGRVQFSTETLANTADAYLLHPVLMDAGFQLLFATLPESDTETFLPVGLDQLSLFAPVRSALWIHGKIRPAQGDPSIRQADLHLFDDEGQCLAMLKGLRVRRIQTAALQQPGRSQWQDWIYRMDWQTQSVNTTALAPQSAQDAAATAAGHWLLLADRGGVATQLSAQLSQQGHTCTLVTAGLTLQLTSPTHWQLDPQRPEDWQQLCKAIAQQSAPLRGIIHLWGADLPTDSSLSTLQRAQQLGVKSGLQLARGLADTLASTPKDASGRGGKLWFVTRGTQSVETAAAQVGAAPLWGLGRVIALERPDIWGGLVDLAAIRQPNEAEQLLSDILAPQGEAIALRQQRYVARLARAALNPVAPLALEADGTYLITGGLGSLGRQLAQHLIKAGARHLVLLSRRPASKASAEVVATLTELAANSKTTVQVLQADITQPDELARVLQDIQARLPRLRGIFHAAGLLDDALIDGQTSERFDRVLAPKVAGAWNLHQLTQDLPLDYFMMFSSVAAMLGSPGQANYAAANSFLDSLAHYRQNRGLPGLSVNWSTWATDGMVERLGDRERQRLTDLGLALIDPDSGWQILDQLLSQPAAPAQIGVVPIRWEQFTAQAPATLPLLADLVDETISSASTAEQAKASQAAGALLSALKQRPPEARAAYMLSHLEDHLRAVLRLNKNYSFDPQQGFFDLGMDSLTSVELRNRLQQSMGQPLSATLIFDYPTLETLSGHLSQMLCPNEPPNEPVETAIQPVETRSPKARLSEARLSEAYEQTSPSINLSEEAVDDLSEDEAEALLLEALAAL